MSTWRILVTVLPLIHPALSQLITSTCEIPSVERGENATITIRFGQDLRKEGIRDFFLDHIGQSSTVSQTRLLDCEFIYGNVTCKETSCCTWERHVTDVFRVYIHNVSQEHEGRFWGFVIPGDAAYQRSCNFRLKAASCSTDSINATNSHMTCSNQSVTPCQTCTVTCNPGYQFKENIYSVIYTCIGKNKWFPENPLTSCKAYTCPTDFINASNSHMKCTTQPVTIGETCIVTCNHGYYFKENQTSVTYRCVGKNKWSTEIPVTSCEVFSEQPKDQETHGLYILLLLLIVFPIAMVIFIFFIRQARKREQNQKDVEEHLLAELEKLKDSTKGEGHPLLSSAENYWLQYVETWYPEFHSRSYFLPPLHFNQEKFTMQNIAGKEVYLLEDTQSSPRVHYDRALQRVLRGMHTPADNGQEKEVMFVVSQLQFGNYLGEPTFAPAVVHLPRPSTLPEELRKQHFDKGDFDVLIIHSQHGLFTLQISSVGENFSQKTMTVQEEAALIKKVEEITNHLKKAEVVLKHLTSDLKPEINITKCLVMPNITSGQLKRAIERNSSTDQLLCECLGAKNVNDAVKLCLMKDQLSDNQTPSDSSLQALREWWQHIRTSRSESFLTSSLYKQLVARFCGPATTVEVHCVTAPRLNIRTLGEAVSETGERVARLVLIPQQVDILNQSPPQAFLSGSPGTGKTIVLIMQGLTWIQLGHDVHVVSTWNGSRAVTIVIEHQLQETVKTSTDRSRVHRHQFDFLKDGEVKKAVSCLKSQSEGRQLCVIADEVVRHDRKSFTELCDQLINEVPGVFIWGASLFHDVRPLCLKEFKLTTPLRSPPVVVREVMEATEIKNKQVHDYTVSDVPVPTDGPPVMRIKHRKGHSGHRGVRPRDCVECGHQVARVLTELNIGQTGDSNGPPPLHYRDALVLCFDYPTDHRVDSNGQVTTTASCLVRGLRDCHVPVRVVEKGDEAAIRYTALGVGDLVTVANWRDVQGLERKVVVVERIDEFDRLYAMSRCTSQLVLIDC